MIKIPLAFLRHALRGMALEHKLYGCHQVQTIDIPELLERVGMCAPVSLAGLLEEFGARYRVVVTHMTTSGIDVDRDASSYESYKAALRLGKRGCKGVDSLGIDWWIELELQGLGVLRRDSIGRWMVDRLEVFAEDQGEVRRVA
jgi:hypothetical protein